MWLLAHWPTWDQVIDLLSAIAGVFAAIAALMARVAVQNFWRYVDAAVFHNVVGGDDPGVKRRPGP